ncbi:MAG: Holliday junction resolvase RuvX [Cyclobacteriaceae bacterium]|jgi:putative Holliday junction resolvase|nr:Holliday junction resolvase RuvX [Cyclobacteriaceae bacterium]
MGRILSIDYGKKRTGLAVTDPLRIIATALDMVASHQLLSYLENYLQREVVDEAIIGMPKTLKNEDSENAPRVRTFISQFKQKFPSIKITEVDERFTSTLAQRALIEGGMKKKDRQVKGHVDKVSAVILLQDYMKTLV